MKIRKTVSAIAVVFLFASISGCAETAPPVTTEQRLAEVRSKAETVNSYRVNMTMEMDVMGQAMTTETQMTFKKPDKFYMKSEMGFLGGATQEVYSTGDIMWTYMSMTKTAMKMDMKKFKDAAGPDMPGMGGMAGNRGITDPFIGHSEDMIEYIEEIDTIEGLAYVFEINMENLMENLGETMPPGASKLKDLFPKEMVVWISADTGLTIKMITIGKNGATMMEQTYSDFEINPEIDDSVFEFTPPEGVQVTDMTEMAENMMKGMKEEQGTQRIPRRPRKNNM
jgi:outer membrane lipoprotein-sorting protein